MLTKEEGHWIIQVNISKITIERHVHEDAVTVAGAGSATYWARPNVRAVVQAPRREAGIFLNKVIARDCSKDRMEMNAPLLLSLRDSHLGWLVWTPRPIDLGFSRELL